MAEQFLEKVTAFIARRNPGALELLLFQHPYAGIQIPAGTVKEGEAPEQAALREAFEETGLGGLRVQRYIGWRDELPPGCDAAILHRTKVYARPDDTSFDWAEFPRGIAVRVLQRQDGYAQVTYEEGDRFPNPSYTSYAITGWVPEENLASTNRRHFFHLIFSGETPPRWERFADSHRYQPFWALFENLPGVIAPQKLWVDFVTKDLGYSFYED